MEGIGSVLRRQPQPAANKKLHSEVHVLADEMCRWFGEPTSGPGNRFGTYLGVIKRLGVTRARTIFAEVKADVQNARNPRKLFMWLTSGKASTSPGGERKIEP
jgi:hypothetical protein